MKTLICFVLLGFFSSVAVAETPASHLTSMLLGIHTMQADFTQSVKDRKGKMLQETAGRMSLERPGKFRWEVNAPIKQLIIANGSRLWIYDVDLEQVTIRAFHKAAGQTPALLLSDKNLTLSKDFVVTEMPTPSQVMGSATFLLKPKREDEAFERIILQFSGNHIQQMRLDDKLGHVAIIRFVHVAMDKPLPASLFTFKPRANVDVIDETKIQR